VSQQALQVSGFLNIAGNQKLDVKISSQNSDERFAATLDRSRQSFEARQSAEMPEREKIAPLPRQASDKFEKNTVVDREAPFMKKQDQPRSEPIQRAESQPISQGRTETAESTLNPPDRPEVALKVTENSETAESAPVSQQVEGEADVTLTKQDAQTILEIAAALAKTNNEPALSGLIDLLNNNAVQEAFTALPNGEEILAQLNTLLQNMQQTMGTPQSLQIITTTSMSIKLNPGASLQGQQGDTFNILNQLKDLGIDVEATLGKLQKLSGKTDADFAKLLNINTATDTTDIKLVAKTVETSAQTVQQKNTSEDVLMQTVKAKPELPTIVTNITGSVNGQNAAQTQANTETTSLFNQKSLTDGQSGAQSGSGEQSDTNQNQNQSQTEALNLLKGKLAPRNGGRAAEAFFIEKSGISQPMQINANANNTGALPIGLAGGINTGMNMPGQQGLANAMSGSGNSAVPLAAGALANSIQKNMAQGKTSFDIRLDPPELGRIHVKLDIDADGNTRTHLTVERQETLDLLNRDARTLEKALQQTGLKTDQSALSFSLRQDQDNQQAFNNFAGNEQKHSSDSQKQSEDHSHSSTEAQVSAEIASQRLALEGRLDVNV
jgi:flagellar hook-length control protein FliK